MEVKALEVRDYHVRKFVSYMLERQDLEQEAYLVYIKSCETFKEGKGTKFVTWYSRLLNNHFVSLYRKERRWFDRRFISSEENENDVIESARDNSWTPEQVMVWNELVTEIEGRLSGLPLELFQARLDVPVEIVRRNITLTAYAQYFKVSRKDIREAMRIIQKSVLIALGKRSNEIQKLTADLLKSF